MAAKSIVDKFDSLKIKPRKIDIKDIRLHRQQSNNKLIRDYITSESPSITGFKKIGNYNALNRLLRELEIKFDEFVKICKDDEKFLKLSALYISKRSTRQCSKDEKDVLEICNKFANQFNITIECIGTQGIYPMVDGKKCEELKSFDGKISGKISGWINHKSSSGSGGNQDNVVIELERFSKWAKEYGKTNEYYVVLFDTDRAKKFNELKDKYKDNINIIIVNSYDFQLWLSIVEPLPSK